MAGQTYSPYRMRGRHLGAPTRAVGRPGIAPRPASARPTVGMANPATASTGIMPATSARASRTVAPIATNARRWVLLGALGIASSVMLTIGVAILGSSEGASANQVTATR